MNSKNQVGINKNWENLFQLWLDKSPPPSFSFTNVEEEILPVLILRLLHSLKSPRILFVFPDTGIAEQNFVYLRNSQKDFPLIRNDIYFLPELLSGNKRLSSDLACRFSNALQLMLSSAPAVFFTSSPALMSFVPAEFAKGNSIILERGKKVNLDQLCSKLVKLNYADECETKIAGEFSRRGGILDLFSPLEKYPARCEFFGDEIEDIRLFDALEQRSLQKVDTYKISPILDFSWQVNNDKLPRIVELINSEVVRTVVFHPSRCREHLSRFIGEEEEDFFNKFVDKPGSVFVLDSLESEGRAGEDFFEIRFPSLDCETALLSRDEGFERSLKRVNILIAEGYTVLVGTKDDEGKNHVSKIIAERPFGDISPLVENICLPSSFKLPEYKIAYISEDDFLAIPFRRIPRISNEISKEFRRKGSLNEFFCDFDEGDYAVHNDYGIGIFRGIVKCEFNGIESESLQIEFDNELMTYTDIHRADLVSKYSGSGKLQPRLSSVGKKNWKKTKTLARKGAAEFAAELLNTQARRMQKVGIRFKKDRKEEKLFEKKFPYTETIDQRNATDEIIKDMELPYPMDRLLCGDAGYGKTEVAMRAAFKAVFSGKQVAVLVPTTVLAQQHYYTFTERFSEYPVLIEMLSRFRTGREQAEILKRLSEGSIDIVIGTHRLLQKDIIFRRLGLLLIDEEQRFGVEHKENFKKIREKVDVISMSATPIPRTLYMAMTGIRDLSTISTPPDERLAVLTYVSKFDKKVIGGAINYELERGGQVFFLHNRIKTIGSAAEMLAKIAPGAQIGIAHGKMNERELEEEMLEFLQGKTQILCCTTIIGSGIDIPNANTLIVDRTENFGLAELYQLRGRVGRSDRQGYAYFLLPPQLRLTANARERIAAVKKHSELGAGFRIALRDLEIRGSGNIIGTEQSGHINAVGFELYCHYLRMASAELQGEKILNLDDCDIHLDFFVFGKIKNPEKTGKAEAYIPADYIEAGILRCRFYRKIATADTEKKLDEIKDEMRDRFGNVPAETLNLLKFQDLKIALMKTEFNKMRINGSKIEICEIRSGKYLLIDGRQPELKSALPDAKYAELKTLLTRISHEKCKIHI